MPGQPTEADRSFIPALRFHALTPLFDRAVRITTREQTFKGRLLDQADVTAGEAVLDLGAGTGTLAIDLKQRVPDARVTGLDADAAALDIARGKAAASTADIDFVEGFSTALPFADGSFDVVLSTLFFHHLKTADKRDTLREVARVLKPSGRLHVGDWGKPDGRVAATLFLTVRALDGFEVTDANARGALPQLFTEAGLEAAGLRDQLLTPLGTLALYSARKPQAS